MSALGSRGEAWFAGQVVLLVAILVAPAWPPVDLPLALRLAGLPLGGIGLSLCLAGLWWLGRNLTPFPRPVADNALVTTGPYRWVRHPIYTGLLVGSVGWALLRASGVGLLLCVVLAVYLDRKASREERWLAERHAGYADYAATVKRLLPWVW